MNYLSFNTALTAISNSLSFVHSTIKWYRSWQEDSSLESTHQSAIKALEFLTLACDASILFDANIENQASASRLAMVSEIATVALKLKQSYGSELNMPDEDIQKLRLKNCSDLVHAIICRPAQLQTIDISSQLNFLEEEKRRVESSKEHIYTHNTLLKSNRLGAIEAQINFLKNNEKITTEARFFSEFLVLMVKKTIDNIEPLQQSQERQER